MRIHNADLRELMHVHAAAAAITVDEGKAVQALDRELAPKGVTTPVQPPATGTEKPSAADLARADAAASIGAMMRRR